MGLCQLDLVITLDDRALTMIHLDVRSFNMSLSPMQEILILLEDEKRVPFFRLNRWGRPARGVLAKLKNLGFAEKEKNDTDIYYKITDKGEKYFDDVLSILKQKDRWDKKWRLVMFNIPEKNRAVRDRLRRALDNLGMGLLQSSVWISSIDIKDKIDKISERLKLKNNLKYFEVLSNPNLDRQIIEKSWDLPKLSLEYDRFIKAANITLKRMGTGNGDRYNSKKLIFEYALLLKKDPKLPLEFTEQNELRGRAHEIYLKLRRYTA